MNTVTVYIEIVPERYVGGIGVTISCKKTDFPNDLKYRLESFLEKQGYQVEQPLMRTQAEGRHHE